MNITLTENEYKQALALKRDLHMHPELSNMEYRTTEKLKKLLSPLPGIRLLPINTETGLIARFEGKNGKREIMLRADIDALPQTEEYDSPWKSVNKGVMHACGHDLHTAALFGAALILSRIYEAGDLHNTVDLVFQPAEEGTTGAKKLIDAGLFDLIHPSLCFGLHNWPSVPVGQIICHEGALMSAKRNFEIHILGSGGHGSMPHLNIDPIVCAASVIESLQTVISRNTSPLEQAVLSINQIEGGSPANLVVDKVSMRATIRSLSDAALERLIKRTETIIHKTAEAYLCRSEILWQEKIPMVYNTEEMTGIARDIASKTGCSIHDTVPSLASEDFALYREYVPSFFFWIGSTPDGEKAEELHRPLFHADDRAVRHGAALYATAALYEND
ncbi:MAG: amidohydrolase [Lachnospiraceae bacterium]|nr:amidohydrolase [Lachnospiraceae bacterium]